jgi:hypothetical protein
MLRSPLRMRGFCTRRLIAAILFVSVFFIPLHVHFLTSATQVTKACSCYHARRTQLGSVPTLASWIPIIQLEIISVIEPDFLGSSSGSSRTIRAPPIT